MARFGSAAAPPGARSPRPRRRTGSSSRPVTRARWGSGDSPSVAGWAGCPRRSGSRSTSSRRSNWSPSTGGSHGIRGVGARAVLGAARGRRQLRRRHPFHVPAGARSRRSSAGASTSPSTIWPARSRPGATSCAPAPDELSVTFLALPAFDPPDVGPERAAARVLRGRRRGGGLARDRPAARAARASRTPTSRGGRYVELVEEAMAPPPVTMVGGNGFADLDDDVDRRLRRLDRRRRRPDDRVDPLPRRRVLPGARRRDGVRHPRPRGDAVPRRAAAARRGSAS